MLVHVCLSVGDYRLQASLSEALCRLTTRKDRQHRANQWFSCRDISTAFCDITLRDFEVVSDRLSQHLSVFLPVPLHDLSVSLSRTVVIF